MIKVVLLGAGNLAFHLTNKLLNTSGIHLVEVYNRTIANIDYLKTKTSITNSLEAIEDADIYILCLSDNAISEVSSKLKATNKLVVHTAGTMAMIGSVLMILLVGGLLFLDWRNKPNEPKADKIN